MKEGKLKTQPSLLENLIFFVEVRHSGFLTVIMMLFYDDVMMCVCVSVCMFSPDGVYSFVDGEPMHQDPPAAQDQSAEEKEEEEKRDEH